MNSSKRPGIQWMRGLAALLVVVDHCLYTLAEKAGGGTGPLPLAAFLGGSGVKVFFIISGLVMILAGTRAFGKGASLEFLRRRAIRVVPLYWLVTLVYAAKLGLEGRLPGVAALAASFLFIPYVNDLGEMQPVYGLGWTLDYEVFFYLLFAIGLLGSLRTTLGVTMLVLGALVWFGTGQAMPSAADIGGVMVFFWSRPIVLFFLAGMALPFVVEWLTRRLGWPRMNLDVAGMGAALLLAWVLVVCYRMDLPVPTQLVLFALPVLVAYMAEAGRGSGLFERATTRLGDASYSIYLTHSFVIGPLARLYAKAGLTAPIAYVLLSLVLCSVVGLLSFRFVETPIIRYLSATAAKFKLAASPAR